MSFLARRRRTLWALFFLAGILMVCMGASAAQTTDAVWYALTLEAEPLPRGDGGAVGRVTADGLCDGGNGQPLRDAALTLRLAGDDAGENVLLTAFSFSDSDAAAMTVLPMDDAGRETGEQKTAAPGRTVALPQGTTQVLCRYFSAEKDIRQLPPGFVTGKVTLDLAYLPGTVDQDTSPDVRVEASCSVENDASGDSVFLPPVTVSLEWDKPAARETALPEITPAASPAPPTPEASAKPTETPRVLTGSIRGTAPGAGIQVALVSPEGNTQALSAQDGSFAFENLKAGAYNLFLPLPENYILTGESPWRETDNGDMVWMAVTLEEGRDAIVPQASYAKGASLSGCAYVDADGGMSRTDGEQLLTGVTIRLQTRGEDGWADLAATQTDEFGVYAFEGLPQGVYRVLAESDAVDYCPAAVGDRALYEGRAACGPELTLAAGEKRVGETDVALQASADLRLTAYLDANGNGEQGPYEAPLMGVTAEVMDGETPIAMSVTDAAGTALVQGVRPGRYPLRLTLPEGYAFTTSEESASGNARITASAAFDFTPGETLAASIGAKPVGSFSGKVFEDLNNDGVMDENDPGVAGVGLRLERVKTGEIYQLTTDETGLFTFSDLADGTYLFSATLPQGMLYARYSRTGGDLRSVFSGSITTREFVISDARHLTDKNVGVVQKGVLQGKAFLDLNYNGFLDEGEPGYPGVTAEAVKISNNESMGKAVTDDQGAFRLENLRGGDYRLRVILPADGSIFTKVPDQPGDLANAFAQRAGRRESSAEPYAIISGGEADALIGVAVGATVQGTVSLDGDYNGVLDSGEKRLSGVTVEAIDALGAVAAKAKTNAEGKYTLEGIMPGAYTLRFARISGYGFTRLRPDKEGGSCVVELLDGYGVTQPMDIAMGQRIVDINAGMLPSATVTGTLFHDLNDDGLPTPDENGLDTARVRLLSQDGEIDWTRNVGADGQYFFDGVMPGEYTLTYLLPEYAEIARVAEGGNTLVNQGRETVSPVFSVAMGEAYECPLAGAVVLGSFRGAVYQDGDGDGARLDGEKGLAGAVITLTPDRTDLEETTVKTGADGSFAVTDLRPAAYQLTVTLPKGFIFSRQGSELGLRFAPGNTQTLACSWNQLTDRNEKSIGAVKPASIAGVIWLDENRDGSRGKKEALLGGLSLELIDEADNSSVARTLSTDAGFLFENVRPGTYTLRFLLPRQAEPAADETSTFAPEGLDMVQRHIAVTQGQKLDGLTTGVASKTSVGGKLTLREGTGSAPVEGVNVSLWLGEEKLQTTVSDEKGDYRFDGLWPGGYRVEAELPGGMIFARQGDTNYPEKATVIAQVEDGLGTSGEFALEMARDLLEQDILYIKPGKIGDQVWLDQNRNGLIDGGEPMIPGVKLWLMAEGEAAYETVSDAYGYYLFDQVYPGTYTLRAEAYPELTITTAVENLSIISSCLISGDGKLAESGRISVASGETNTDCNAGYQLLEGRQLPAAIVAPPQRDWTESNVKFDGIQQQQR